MAQNPSKQSGAEDVPAAVEESKRALLKSLAKGAYVAPVALAMMTTKASACSLTC